MEDKKIQIMNIQHKFLGKFLLCDNIHVVTKYFETLEDVVVGYLAQSDTDTIIWNLFYHPLVL